MTKTFAELGLSEQTCSAARRRLRVALADPGAGDPAALEGRDVIGQAQTGTGKTAAFGLPIVQYIDPEVHEVQALVLTPTRELCIQVNQALRPMAHIVGWTWWRCSAAADPHPAGAIVRRGTHRRRDRRARAGSDLAIPIVLHDCRFVVLDEADEMLDLGFLEDVEKILSMTPSGRQTALFSATMPPPIRSSPTSTCTTRR